MEGQNRADPLRERSLEFAVRIVGTARRLRDERREFALADQLLRSGTSIGANLSEAVFASSRPDFLSKNKIALKECSETLYWLRLLSRCDLLPEEECVSLQSDCTQLLRMMISVCKTIETNPSPFPPKKGNIQ